MAAPARSSPQRKAREASPQKFQERKPREASTQRLQQQRARESSPQKFQERKAREAFPQKMQERTTRVASTPQLQQRKAREASPQNLQERNAREASPQKVQERKAREASPQKMQERKAREASTQQLQQRKAREASPRQLQQRVRELEIAERDSKRAQVKNERQKQKALADAKKRVNKELQLATNVVQRGEKEASRILSMVKNVEQQAVQIKQSQVRQLAAYEESVAKIKAKRGELEADLLQKTSLIGEARGKLAHVSLAAKMLETGMIVPIGSSGTTDDRGCQNAGSECLAEGCTPARSDGELAFQPVAADITNGSTCKVEDGEAPAQSKTAQASKNAAGLTERRESEHDGERSQQEGHEKGALSESHIGAFVTQDEDVESIGDRLRNQVRENGTKIDELITQIRAVRDSVPAEGCSVTSQLRSFSLQVPPGRSATPYITPVRVRPLTPCVRLSVRPVKKQQTGTLQSSIITGAIASDTGDELLYATSEHTSQSSDQDGFFSSVDKRGTTGSRVKVEAVSGNLSQTSPAGVLTLPQGYLQSPIGSHRSSVPASSVCTGFETPQKSACATPSAVVSIFQGTSANHRMQQISPPRDRVGFTPPPSVCVPATTQRCPLGACGEGGALPVSAMRNTVHGVNFAAKCNSSAPMLLMNMRNLSSPMNATLRAKWNETGGVKGIVVEQIGTPASAVAMRATSLACVR